MSERLTDLGEDKLVARLVAGFPLGGALRVGPGDDCAVVEDGGGILRLLKTDAIVEGVHFLREADPEQVGWKAVARVWSDFAAMGGWPEHALVTLAVEASREVAWVEGVYRGIRRCLEEHGGYLAGGETTRLPGGALISVAGEGRVREGRLVLRSGGRPGDAVLVTGRLGGSIRGKHLTFQPRLREAAWLVEHVKPTAMMDLSDGVAKDLPRLAAASGCGFRLGEVPCEEGCDRASALGDGEDYELLMTADPEGLEEALAAWAREFPDLPLSRIGMLTNSECEMDVCGGWDHFGEHEATDRDLL